MANAKAGLDKADAPKIKKITDFNKEEEAKAAELKAVEDTKEKKAKLNKDGRFICANKGCTKRTFTDEENDAEDEPCSYHSGEPIFHDLNKYWSCCNPTGKGRAIAYDWDAFMKLETCVKGKH